MNMHNIRDKYKSWESITHFATISQYGVTLDPLLSIPL